jgi:chromosome segregation ATPase
VSVTAQPDGRAKLELRRRLQEAGDRVIALQKQRDQLEQVRGRAAADEQALILDLQAAERECGLLGAELEQDRQRTSQIELEIARLEQDIADSAAELEGAQRSADQQALRAKAAERELDATRQRLELARTSLADAAQAVVRLSYRVEHESTDRPPSARR